jgi:hypothetical protein
LLFYRHRRVRKSRASYFSVQKSGLKAALYKGWGAASMADRYFCLPDGKKCLTKDCICV